MNLPDFGDSGEIEKFEYKNELLNKAKKQGVKIMNDLMNFKNQMKKRKEDKQKKDNQNNENNNDEFNIQNSVPIPQSKLLIKKQNK